VRVAGATIIDYACSSFNARAKALLEHFQAKWIPARLEMLQLLMLNNDWGRDEDAKTQDTAFW